MTFSEMASMTGGGVQTPGFMGHGKQSSSLQSLSAAEAGPGIVWMPRAEGSGPRAPECHCQEMYGVDNFTDMIAT